MKPESDANGSFRLLANGRAGCWSVDLDESRDGREWSLQLDGPQVYLTFAVRDLTVIRSAIAYLREGFRRADALPLGHFESAGVSLHWDDEFPDRCFLIVGPHARAALRVAVMADDAATLAEALEQVQQDLPDEQTG